MKLILVILFSLLIFICIVFFNYFVNPMLNLVSLLGLSLILAQKTMSLNQTWLSMILILIYSGGMLVLFLFVISLTPNFKSFSPSLLGVLLFSIVFIFFYSFSSTKFNSSYMFFSVGQLYFLSFIFLCVTLMLFLFLVMKILMMPSKALKASF